MKLQDQYTVNQRTDSVLAKREQLHLAINAASPSRKLDPLAGQRPAKELSGEWQLIARHTGAPYTSVGNKKTGFRLQGVNLA